MHTLLARDDAATTHLSSSLPHLVLHYDSCSGTVSYLPPNSTPVPEEEEDDDCDCDYDDEDMRDPPSPRTTRRHVNAQQAGRHPSTDNAPAKRQSSKFGTIMRRLIPRKSERHHASLPNEVFRPPLPHNYPGGMGPGKHAYGHRPVSTPDKQDLPQSPLSAHPAAIAGSADAVSRVTQFVNQKGELPRGSSLPNFLFSTQVAGQTWYDTGDTSLGSEQTEQAASNESSQRSLASSRHRSRSVSALSDSTRLSERHVLRKQKSAKSLRRSKDGSGRRHNTTPDVPDIPLRQSGSSSNVPERVVSELPAEVPDIPEIPHPAPQLLPVPRPESSRTEQPNEPRQTFDFSSLATAMRSQDEINLQTHEERLTAMEVKMMNLEYAISKVQGRLPPDRPISYRKPSTETSSAMERVYSPTQTEPLPQRRKTPPPYLQHGSSAPAEPIRTRSLSSSTSTVRPSRPAPPPPSQRPPPPPTLPTGEEQEEEEEAAADDLPGSLEILVEATSTTSPRRTSVTLLTIDHYSKLIKLLRHEQAARRQLADEVHNLQAEITALRPLAHSPLGASYRSWRDAKSQTMEKGWAVIEEFRAGKPVGQSDSLDIERDDVDVTTVGTQTARVRPEVDVAGAGSVGVGEQLQERDQVPVPHSPAVSDASSDASFGNAYAIPADGTRQEERIFYTGVPAGQAF